VLQHLAALMDADGNSTVAVARPAGGAPSWPLDVNTSRYAAGGWTPIATVEDPNSPQLNAIAAGGHGQLVVTDDVPTANGRANTLTAHLYDPHAGWTLQQESGTNGDGQAAILADGTVLFVWDVYVATPNNGSSCHLVFSALPPNGGTWTSPAMIDGSTPDTDATGWDCAPALLVDPGGGAVVVTQIAYNRNVPMQGLRLHWFQNGSFTAAQTVMTDAIPVPRAALAVGGGTVIVALDASTFIHATATSQQRLTLPGGPNPLLGGEVLAVAMTSGGKALVAWNEVINGGAANEGYYRRFDPSSGWTSPVQGTVDGGAGAEITAVAMNDEGKAMAVWQSDHIYGGDVPYALWLSPLP
jgi:hypothetical protein